MDSPITTAIKAFCERQGWLSNIREVSFLAAGEYNENYRIQDSSDDYVFRINRGSQLDLENQIEYEFRTLKILENTGVTPRAFYFDNGPNPFRSGVLLEEFAEGRALDYSKDIDSAALVFTKIHGVSDHGNLIAWNNPAGDIADAFTLILANPPFKGSLDEETVAKDLLRTVKTKKTELLFIALMLRLLKPGGRCAVIVPDGVLFGSSKAHLDLRKILVDGHKLEAMISMPSGVFRPYAGVSTGILIFTKTNSGGTDHVWFYDMQADGFSLDDKRNPVEENDIPDVLARWQGRDPARDCDRTARAFCVPVQEIRDNKYDLSINRYKKVEHEEVAYEAPQVIIARLEALEKEIAGELAELKGMVGSTPLTDRNVSAG